MTRGRRNFDDETVLEMLRLRRRMGPAQIARRLQTDPTLVRRVLIGQTYRHLTHRDAPDRRCHCPSCSTARLSEDNLEHVRAMPVTLPCMFCNGDAVTTVAKALASHGLFPCAKCERKE